MHTPTLYQFFHRQLAHAFQAHGLAEPQAVDYVSDLLTRFAHTRALYALRSQEDRPLEHIVDMLLAHQQALDDRAESHSRKILRHVAEYTLFMSGLFRDRLRSRGELEYYLAHGSSAFWQCAESEYHPPRRRLYHRLHDRFRAISGILDHMRSVQWPLAEREDRQSFLAAVWRR